MSHIPVLKNEVLETFSYLKEFKRTIFVDGTLGTGGHSLAIAKNFQFPISNFQFIGIDRDELALKIAKNNVAKAGLTDQFRFAHNDFKNITEILEKLKIDKIDGALLDLGVSSMQLDEKERGFSFRDPNQPLDMRMDRQSELTASDIVKRYSENALTKIIFDYGEERWAKAIAREIVSTRKIKRIATVGNLLATISRALPANIKHAGGKHFATRTFQALRIEVNRELAGLDKAIIDFTEILNPGGHLAVISFHSLEDRIIKQTFHQLAKPCTCPEEMPCICGKSPIVKILTKRPVTPTEKEVRENIRSRSAKLRVIEKI